MRRAACRVVVALGVCVFLGHSVQAAECTRAHYECALFYVEHQNFQAAIQSLNAELRQQPHHLNALNLLGIALTGAGQPQEAAVTFKQALIVNPHFYPARKNLAINEFDLRRFAAAETQFNRVLKDAPDDEIAHLYLAEISFEKKDLAAAAKHYEKGRKRIALKAFWILQYAECLLAQNEASQATEVLKLLPQEDGENRFQAGLILGRSAVYSQAAEFFASARKHYSDPYVAGYNQLLMLIRGKSYPEAIQLFHDLTAQGEDYQRAELYNLVSEAYLKTDRVQEAYDVLRTATRLEPEAEDNYVDLASVCLEYEDYPLGKEILDVGIHYIPKSYRLYIQRGVTFVMRGSLAEAEQDFQTASDLAPDKSLPYFALGWVWVQSAQTDKAVKVLREKSRLPGMDFLVPYIFAVALVHSGAEPGTPAADEAVAAFESSIRLNSNFSHSHSELGKLLFKQGQVEQAITELKTATTLDPGDSGPVYVLAQAYRKKGQKAEADEMLAKIAQLHSEDHNLDLKKELKRLVRQDAAPSSQMQATP
jgi:tetratricopeptide (TPR) repeat protein